MTKNYLQLEFTSGLLFDYSKDEKDGYDKHVSTKGNTSYRKYYKDGVSGVLESVSIYESKFGNDISMNIKDGDNIYYVPVSISDQKGNVDTYAESLTKLLPQLEKGMNVLVRGYNFTPEGDKYPKIGISISVDGVKLKSEMTNSYINKEGVLVEGDIPALVWKKDALGKNKPSAVSQEAKNDYLLQVIKTQTDRLMWVKQEQTEQKVDAKKVPTATPSEAFEPASNFKEEKYDDLPF